MNTREDGDNWSGALEFLQSKFGRLVWLRCRWWGWGPCVGMLRILPATRASFDGISGGTLRLLGVHGAVVSAVTPATCGQRDIVA